MVKKVSALLLGVGFAVLVVWLGYESVQDGASPLFILGFGLASAFLAPLVISAFTYAIRTRDQQEALERLTKIPQLQALYEQAETQEDKVRLLREERANLDEVVRLEARRQTLLAQQASLEDSGREVLERLKAVSAELETLEGIERGPAVSEEIKNLQERIEARRRGDMLIHLGSSRYFIVPEEIGKVPVMGEYLLIYAKVAEYLSKMILELMQVLARSNRRK